MPQRRKKHRQPSPTTEPPRSVFHDATDDPCPKCLELAKEGRIRGETVMPLPACPPRDLDNQPCCRDCAAAGTVQRLGGHPEFYAARIAVGNDRQEQLRLPGAPLGLVYHRLVQPCAPGDLERHSAWLERRVWPQLEGVPQP